MGKGTDKAKIMIAAGGTGGHIYPGVAIADEFSRRLPEVEIVFAGTERGLETKVVPKLGRRLALIRSTSIKDRKGMGRFIAYARLPLSVMHAARLILREKPSLLVSIGGYAAGPLSIAAWLLRVPFVLVEPNAIAGLTNRKIGKLCDRAFVAFDDARAYFPREKVIVSGNPVRAEVASARGAERKPGPKVTFFVFGGSQGAMKLNRSMVGSLPGLSDLKARFRVIHQTGANDDASAIERAYAEAGVEAQVFAFTERIWECYREADVVIARSGATTVAELLALRIPSILVPYPYAADDHQRANAVGMLRTGGAVMIPDADFTTEKLTSELRSFIERPSRIEAMQAALRRHTACDAAGIIVDECVKLLSQEGK